VIDPLIATCACAESHPAQVRQLEEQAECYDDWVTLPERAESIGSAPLVFEHLQFAGITIPEDSRRALSALTIRHRQANQIRYSILVEILSAFNDEDIGALVLKGAALANTVYPRPGLRPMRDIDILVREKDALRAQQKLIDLGFDAKQPRIGGNGAKHHLPPAQRVVDGLNVSVEIHHKLFPYAADAPTYEDLSAGSISFLVNGVTAQTLAHEDTLWHIYRHSFGPPLIDQPIRLIWVADFISLVEKYAEEIDWEKVKRSYPEVWNVLPVFHFLTPWSDNVLGRLNIEIDPPPKGIGQTFQGWPQSSLALQRQKGLREFLADTFWPSEWWLQLYYGVSRPSLRWWWIRLLGHPLHIAGWLLQYVRE